MSPCKGPCSPHEVNPLEVNPLAVHTVHPPLLLQAVHTYRARMSCNTTCSPTAPSASVTSTASPPSSSASGSSPLPSPPWRETVRKWDQEWETGWATRGGALFSSLLLLAIAITALDRRYTLHSTPADLSEPRNQPQQGATLSQGRLAPSPEAEAALMQPCPTLCSGQPQGALLSPDPTRHCPWAPAPPRRTTAEASGRPG